MKKKIFVSLMFACMGVFAFAEAPIRISTEQTDLLLQVTPQGRLYQLYLGDRLNENDIQTFVENNSSLMKNGWEVYPGSGMESYYEPALAINHPDGNPSTLLTFVRSETQSAPGVTETIIYLRDEKYPVEVTLHYMAYSKENVIKVWSEIHHRSKRPIELWRYASAMLYFNQSNYYLTQFNGRWASEVRMASQPLLFGKKILDSKLGARASKLLAPFFEIGFDQPAQEHQGRVMLGTLNWTGNFSFTFEVDQFGALRVIPAINSYASTYRLMPNETFVTPEFVFTLSNEGSGAASRNFHDWARRYQLKEGMGDRMILLNNWENTYFDFNESKLEELIKEAKELGVDLFLLDDGWFGNKYPRQSDKAGLGDWEVTASKLPNGIAHLVQTSEQTGVKFGIWIEPEMVNPKSELYEKHPDWVIHLPNREEYYYRNQLVLDLTNPRVQEHVYGVVDRIMKENPNVAYFKWDCNSPITNIYSPYLKETQGNLYIDYVRGLYAVMRKVKQNYPTIPMMLCAGGGGRCDYEALKYFTEFWCSDNTDPIERLYIQWGFSQLFPAKAMCAHVTSWNKSTSVKFRVDVASMCKLGFDIGLKEMPKEDLAYCQEAIKNYNRLKPIIYDGDQYRLVSPYEGNHMVVSYVDKDRSRAVLFSYDLYPRYNEPLFPVKLQGLSPDKNYVVREINLMPNQKSVFSASGKTYSGRYLMQIGLDLLTKEKTNSRVFEIMAQ